MVNSLIQEQSKRILFRVSYLVSVSMVRQFSWKYRREHSTQFPFVCDICRHTKGRFKTLKDKENHDKMTSRHNRNFKTMAMASGSIDSIRDETDLEKFIRDHVQTDDAFRRVCKGVIKNVSDILKNNIEGKYRPDEVLKTGSTAKGTAIKGKSDVDLVFLLSSSQYQSVDQLQNDLQAILVYIRDALIPFTQYRNAQVHQRAVSFEIACKEPGTGYGHLINVDILPAVNFGYFADIRSIHTQMRGTSEEKRNLYTPSLTKWQREFVKRHRTEQLKKLIRFVKYWKNVSIQTSPSSFALELLVIHLWSQDGSPVHFKLPNALKKVMETIAVPDRIRVEFVGEYYNKEFQQSTNFLQVYNNMADNREFRQID
ncbi:2'-5'-oligoadenylate synthase 1A-like isoform X4 [Mytilus californianus]|uniref:2'-5'-oligoadenylate synthase 1A-like isoform X4 n=1 Tax=Mytilus californianus TaxID=6549 RepID=UPI0022450E92|nr:2'-5'-oligoadenylate synthase 1A-like isoform X4 [Mytilus californianus]